jgi:hypothetical protein
MRGKCEVFSDEFGDDVFDDDDAYNDNKDDSSYYAFTVMAFPFVNWLLDVRVLPTSFVSY